jgi:hypothetical protein
MTENESTLICYLTILAFALLVSFYVLADVAERSDSLKEEAIKLGYAEWMIICADKTEFKWKERH